MKDNTKTKMTTFIKTKFKISEEIGLLWSSQSFEESTISDLESPSNFQVKEEKNYSNRSINEEIGHLWSESGLRESTISDLESPSNFQVKEKKIIEIGPVITKLCLY